MASANVKREIDRLDALSRERELTRRESRMPSLLITTERRYTWRADGRRRSAS